MKGKTFLTAMLVSMAFMIGVSIYDIHTANYFGLGVCGFFLVFYFPVMIWSALGRIKHEKEMAYLRSPEFLAKCQKEADEFVENFRKEHKL